MKKLAQYFVEGVLVLAPIALTIYVVGRVLALLQTLGEKYILLGMVRLPGVGLVIAVAAITLLGFLTRNWVVRRALDFGESLMARIPLVKSVFGSFKDVVDAFGGKKQSFSKAALVRVPGMPVELLGFVTSEELDLLGEPGRNKVSVYVPAALQLGGFVVIVPRENVTLLETPPQAALKFLMTGGMTDGGAGG